MSLKLQEARRRAQLISDVETVIHFDVTPTDRYTLKATITFACSEPGAESFLELAGATDVTVAGVEASYDGERITMHNLAAHNSVTVRASMPYVTDGDGMTPVVDPADGERYVSAYTAMDIAHRVLPCFDQPDIKTTFTLSVTAPSHWTVLANGRFDRREGDTWFFRKTPRFSSYIFFFCGGPFVSITWDEPYALADGGSLPFGWHARASMSDALHRDFESLRATTSGAFKYYTDTFDEPYPFEDYQQVFTPGLNWGAMEFPGCVSFRDEYLTPAPPTAMERHGMSSVIAHEMAHMWFGDLVTFTWWEDSWLNESFADFCGFEVSGRVTGENAWTAAATGRKPTAYRADSRRSTHPIAEDPENLPDVDTAFANFDMITYAKGNSVLRQLVVWLGEEAFNAGVNKHLSAHPFGNATLADFLDALASATDRDVRGWAQAWLRTTGFDTIEVQRDGDVPVLVRHGSRPHRFTVTAFNADGTIAREQLVDLAQEPVRLEAFAGLAVLPNSNDETYAMLDLDTTSQQTLDTALGTIESTLTRAMLWATAVLQVERGKRTPESLVELAAAHLATEADATVFEGAFTQVLAVTTSHSAPENVAANFASLAGVAAAQRANPTLGAAADRFFAATSDDLDTLVALLEPSDDQSLRWSIIARLAALGDTSRIEAESARDRTTVGEQAALRAKAAVPTIEAKTEAWARLLSGELSNRDFTAMARGFWAGDAELVAPWVLKAPADFGDLARRSGQAMGQIISRALPVLPMTTEAATAYAAALRDELTRDVPTVAARGFNDHLDDLERMIATRA